MPKNYNTYEELIYTNNAIYLEEVEAFNDNYEVVIDNNNDDIFDYEEVLTYVN